MTSEAEIQQQIRLAASRLGWRIFRNNSGAGKLENGSFVRWGLANESSATNMMVKSGDQIGIRPVLITQAMVGQVIGQFCSIEVKSAAWRPRPNDLHEQAQRRWAKIVNDLGGYAVITNDVGDIR